MRTPSAAELVRVWELGFDRAPWHRALLMLAPAFADRSFEQLAGWSIGERNVRLMALRVLLFGSPVEATVACPRCAVPLEFSFDLLELCPAASAPGPARSHDFVVETADAERLACRSATSADLAALGGLDGDMMRAQLARRLVLGALGTEASAPPTLDETLASRIASALEDADPFAQMQMAFDCAACAYEWSAPFDIVEFLWSELSTQVHRILEEVQRLARSYGWSEGAILSMTGLRRRFYLDRAS